MSRSVKLAIRYDFGAMSLYNPFFNDKIPAPAALAIFDFEKKYIGDWLFRTSDSLTHPEVADWIINAQGGFIELEREFPVALRTRDGIVKIKPGKYFTQLIFHSRIGSLPPVDDIAHELTKDRISAWHSRFADFTACRSNILEIEIGE